MRTGVRSTDGGFFADYARSKGPAEFEEVSDAVQRPLGYLVARALKSTPVSPNAVTCAAMLSALAGGVAFALQQGELGAALVLSSAVLDSSDGQLARMRNTSSLTGRMLDGTSDLVGAVCVLTGATWMLVAEHGTSPGRIALVVGACFATALTSSFQHSMFDHYKNVWVRMTVPGAALPDDWETAQARRDEAGKVGTVATVAWATYLSYLKGQLDYTRRYDPWTRTRDLPAYDSVRAARYRREHAAVMRAWTLFFGFGTMMLGVVLAAAFDLLEAFVVFRLVVLNGIFYGWLRTAQRRASRASFESDDAYAAPCPGAAEASS